LVHLSFSSYEHKSVLVYNIFSSAEKSFINSMLKKLVPRIKKVEQHPRGSNFFPLESGLLSGAIFPQNIFRIKFLTRFAFQLNTVMYSQQSGRCLNLLLMLSLSLSSSLLSSSLLSSLSSLSFSLFIMIYLLLVVSKVTARC